MCESRALQEGSIFVPHYRSVLFDSLKWEETERPRHEPWPFDRRPGELVPGHQALMEGQVPQGLDPLSGWVLHLQPQLHGGDQHLEDWRRRGSEPSTFDCRGSPADPRSCPRVSARLPEGQKDGQHEVLVRVAIDHLDGGPETLTEVRKRYRKYQGAQLSV